jgi:hypothetical protein
MAIPMKALALLALVVGIPSACVIENHSSSPPPAPVRVVPPAPVVDAGAVDAEKEGSAPVDAAEGGSILAVDAALSGSPPAAAAGAVAPPVAAFLVCAVDADCVAVKRNGCCNNGYKEAVNASSAAAYEASFVCPDPHPICPMFRVRDERSPECNEKAHECELVKPDQIQCGGTGPSAHQCPGSLHCTAPANAGGRGHCGP